VDVPVRRRAARELECCSIDLAHNLTTRSAAEQWWTRVRYLLLACDYDGTIAHHGVVDAETMGALERFRATRRRLLLVTGRELDDLMRVCPDLSVFERVVAENGAVLYTPATRHVQTLATAPPETFVKELERRGVTPLSAGRVIVATWRPHEHVVFEAIRDLGLELHVIFNKDAVMVLPSGVNKASGLIAALEQLGMSVHNAVGIGDAENDHAFLAACECSVAVANAIPSLKGHADLVTSGDHGRGVAELIDRMLASDLVEIEPAVARHELLLGYTQAGDELRLKPYGETVLIAGPSGAGKSTITTFVLEGLCNARYQFCIIDPEGDYQELESAVSLRGSDRRTLVDEAFQILRRPDQNLVISLLDIRLEDRPKFFHAFLPLLQEHRTRTGRPHWLVIDEAHHMLPMELQSSEDILPSRIGSVLMITVHPEHISPAARRLMRSLIVVGTDVAGVARAFAGSSPDFETVPPALLDTRGRWACLFRPGTSPVWLRIPEPQQDRQRHRRKYAEGELGEDKSFYFRGPDNRLRLRAQNLAMFSQLADGVDDDTWLHHLRRGDYSQWFRDSIGDEELASAAAAVERDDSLTPTDSRVRIRRAIEERYTSPA
jgi:HAD superfamily hydrolase (TIGR01484 family)